MKKNLVPKPPKVFIFIFFGFILFGYVAGKIEVGRRGDRLKTALEEAASVPVEPMASIPPGISRETGEPKAVAVATESHLPMLSQSSTDLPDPPFLVSWCEGEGCSHRYTKEVVCKADLLEDAKDDAKVVSTLKPGTMLETRIYYTKVLALGSYLPLEAPRRTLISRQRKNLWVTFHDHSWDSAEWPSDLYEKNPVYEVKYPKTEAWALVKTRSGLTGFLKIKEGEKPCPFSKAPPISPGL